MNDVNVADAVSPAAAVVVTAAPTPAAPTMTLEQANALVAIKRPIGHPGKEVVTQLKIARMVIKAEKLRLKNIQKAATRQRNDAKKDAERNAKKAARLAALQAEVAAEQAKASAAAATPTVVTASTVPSADETPSS